LAGGFGLLGPLVRHLASDFRVISYQLRGEDDCFALRRRFGLLDLVSDLAEFTDFLCLEQPAILGISFGGVLALEFAARFPNRIRQLAVQGAGAQFERGIIHQVAGMILNRYPLPSNSPFVNQFFNVLFGSRQPPGPLFDFVTRQCWQTDQGVMAHRFRLLKQFRVSERLERIRASTLIMAGERDFLVSEQSLKLLTDGLSDCRLVRLPGCGHLAFVTQPNHVAFELRQFFSN
jgi:pimeloyl-ACP methyl ester carboxylesterase